MSECRIKFWGVRGSVPAPGPSTVHFGGNTPCVEVRAEGEIIVLDAGTGIRLLGTALAQEFGEKPIALTLLISHPHWDHIHGFPFFLPAYCEKNKIHILGYADFRLGLQNTLEGQMESPYFPIALKELQGNIVIDELCDVEFPIGAVRVRAHRANHPGIAMGYRLFTSAGSVVYLPDNEPFGSHRVSHIGTADRVDEKFVEFARGADVLITDAQYTGGEYEHHVGWGHACVNDVVGLAIEAGVKRLFLFHHDPGHDDAFIHAMLDGARNLAAAKGSALVIDAAREGEEVVLGTG